MERVLKLGKQTFSSLKIRNYRLYFIGQAVSVCGSWIQSVSLAWLVLLLTKSGTQLGLVTAAQFLPVLVFGPIAGVLVDKFSKRKILLLTQTSFAVLALALALLVSTHTIQLWMIYALSVLTGLVTSLDTPTRQTFVAEMVGNDQLTNALSLNSVQFNLARVVGPAIAGILIASVGLSLCFYINATSFAAVIGGVLMMDRKALRPLARVKEIKGQLRAGLEYIKSTKVLLNTLIMLAIIGTLAFEFQVSLPLFAAFTFKGNASVYALLTSAMGVGAVAGGLYTATRKKTSYNLLIFSAVIFGAALLLAAVSPSLSIAVIAIGLVGFSSINFNSVGNVTLQMESTPEMRGRVMSLWAVAYLGSTPIGGPIIGYVSQVSNPRWGLAVGGIATVLAAGWGAIALRKQQLEPQKNKI